MCHLVLAMVNCFLVHHRVAVCNSATVLVWVTSLGQLALLHLFLQSMWKNQKERSFISLLLGGKTVFVDISLCLRSMLTPSEVLFLFCKFLATCLEWCVFCSYLLYISTVQSQHIWRILSNGASKAELWNWLTQKLRPVVGCVRYTC